MFIHIASLIILLAATQQAQSVCMNSYKKCMDAAVAEAATKPLPGDVYTQSVDLGLAEAQTTQPLFGKRRLYFTECNGTNYESCPTPLADGCCCVCDAARGLCVDDCPTEPEDLYDVLTAYRRLRPGA